MKEVQPGDVIFSYYRQTIAAVSISKRRAFVSPRPRNFPPTTPWNEEGRRIDVSYRKLEPPLPLSHVRSELQPFLPEKYSPLTREGTGVQAYLFKLPPKAGQLLLERVGMNEHVDGDQIVQSAIEQTEDSYLRPTERQAIVQSRMGQGAFRQRVLELWRRRCSVTGFDIEPLLRASHIKPWRDSTNQERLDPYNGLLLCPSYDAAFDQGYISFDHDGKLLLGKDFTKGQATTLGISSSARLSKLRPKTMQYLEYHRKSVLKGPS